MNTLPEEIRKYIDQRGIGLFDDEKELIIKATLDVSKKFFESQLSEIDARIVELVENYEGMKGHCDNLTRINVENMMIDNVLKDRISELEHLLVLKSTEAEVAQKLYEESKEELETLRKFDER